MAEVYKSHRTGPMGAYVSGLAGIAICLLLTPAFAFYDSPAVIAFQVLVVPSRHMSTSVLQSFGEPLPSIGAPQPLIGRSNSRFRTIAPRHRLLVPFFGFAEYPNVTVVVPQASAPAEEPVVIQPHSAAPSVFFIEKCGKFIRIPLPEAKNDVLSIDQQKCD